jgi:hypothetical protein
MFETALTLKFTNPGDGAAFFEALAQAYRALAASTKTAVASVTDSVSRSATPAHPPEPVADVRGLSDTGDGSASTGKTRGRPRKDAATPTAKTAPADPSTDPEYLLEGPDGIRAAGRAILDKTKDGGVILGILEPFGAGKYPDVPPARRQELLDALNAKRKELGA